MDTLAMLDILPLLTLFGVLFVVFVVLVIVFWPWIESPLIAFLVGVRGWRANRKRTRDLNRRRR